MVYLWPSGLIVRLTAWWSDCLMVACGLRLTYGLENSFVLMERLSDACYLIYRGVSRMTLELYLTGIFFCYQI